MVEESRVPVGLLDRDIWGQSTRDGDLKCLLRCWCVHHNAGRMWILIVRILTFQFPPDRKDRAGYI